MAEEEVAGARAAVDEAGRAHAARLAQTLEVGDDCPVCQRPVTDLPHHPEPPGLASAKARVDAATKVHKQGGAGAGGEGGRGRGEGGG